MTLFLRLTVLAHVLLHWTTPDLMCVMFCVKLRERYQDFVRKRSIRANTTIVTALEVDFTITSVLTDLALVAPMPRVFSSVAVWSP